MAQRTLHKAAQGLALAALLTGVACGGKPFTSGAGQSGGAAGASAAESGGTAPGAGGASAAGSGGTASASGGDAGVSGGSSEAGAASGGGGANGGKAGEGGVGGLALPTAGSAGRPAAISSEGLVLWLDAERGVTESSGAISRWADQSGRAAHATQPEAGARPRKVSAGGGRDMIELDGVDDFMLLADGFEDWTSGVTFFEVVELLEDTGEIGLLDLSNGPEVDDLYIGRQDGTVHYEVADGTVRSTSDVFSVGERHLIGVQHREDGIVEIRLNGEFVGGGSLPLPATAARYDNFMGRSLYAANHALHARVGEIILYARALDNAERVRVERYLADKWK